MTKVRFRTFYRRAKIGGTRVPTTIADILGVRFKLDNLFGGSLAIPEALQPKTKMPARGLPCCSTAATQVPIPTGDIPGAVCDQLPTYTSVLPDLTGIRAAEEKKEVLLSSRDKGNPASCVVVP